MASPEKGLTRLHSLDAEEISLVPKGANRRKFLIFKSAEDDDLEDEELDDEEDELPRRVKKDKLSTEGRKDIDDKNFALPKERKYPIHDMSHARNALARSSGKPEEAKVRAAVERKYPSLKPDSGVKKGAKMAAASQSLQDMISKTDPNVMKKVEDCIKSHYAGVGKGLGAPDCDPEEDGDNPDAAPAASGTLEKEDTGAPSEGGGMDDQSTAAVKAVVRILNPFKAKISPLLMHQIIDAAGFELTSNGAGNEPGATKIGDGMQEGAAAEMEDKEGGVAYPEKIESTVSKAHMDEAMADGQKAYKEKMEKLGYRMYPDAEMTMKTKDGAPVAKEKGEPVSKSATPATTNALDLSTVDASTRQKVEKIFKSHNDAITSLQEQIKARDARDRHKEIVAKAASFQNIGLPSDEIVATLEDADKVSKESYERIVKNFEVLNEQGKNSKLFTEMGSNLPAGSNDSANAWAKIEKAAQGWVAKSGDTKMSNAQAVEAFLNTAEGGKLYADYKAGRKDGI